VVDSSYGVFFLLLPVVVVAMKGEMWLNRVMVFLLSVVLVVMRVEMWLIRVMGVFAACGSDGYEGD
jgi:hypothetical protein